MTTSPPAQTAPIRPVGRNPESRWDDLAEQIADAWGAGDDRRADRLYDEFHVKHLAPRLARRVKSVVFEDEMREAVFARVVLRVLSAMQIGKPFYESWLAQNIRWALGDALKTGNERRLDKQAFPDDVELVDKVIHHAGGSHAGADTNPTITRDDLLHITKHFRNDLKQDQWADVWMVMMEGHGSDKGYGDGPAIAKRLGIRQVRARQIKSKLCQYLAGPGRHLLEGYDIDGKERP